MDLNKNYAGLDTFFEQVRAHWHEWENSQMTWGKRTELELEFLRVRGPARDVPDYLILSIALRNHGWHVQLWSIETSLTVEEHELQSITRDLRRLTD